MAFMSSEDPSSLSKEKVRSGGPAIFLPNYQTSLSPEDEEDFDQRERRRGSDTSEAKPRQMLVGSSYLPPISDLVLTGTTFRNGSASTTITDDMEQVLIGTGG